MQIDGHFPHIQLSQVMEGSRVRVAGLTGDREFKRRLASFGIRTGTRLRLLQRLSPKQAVLGIGFGHVAVGEEMLGAIRVVPEDETGAMG